MIKEYKSRWDIDFRYGDVEIALNGDGQEIRFTFMIAFFSVPSFFWLLLRLWDRKTDKFDIDGHGFAVQYYFNLLENLLFVEVLTYDENGQPIRCNYEFDFEKFVKAIDRGFAEYLKEQRNNGILPLKREEHSHPLSKQVIEEYEEFSAIINKM